MNNKKNPSRAIECYKKALDLGKNSVEILFRLAVIYYYNEDMQEAYQYITQLEKLCPESFVLYDTKATICRTAGWLEEEKDALEKAVTLEPNRSYQNDKLMEYYLRRTDLQTIQTRWPRPEIPWYGQSLAGHTCVLPIATAGWGIGDAIQMLRYAQVLKNLGAQVLVQAPDILYTLFAHCPFIDSLITQKEKLPAHTLLFPPTLYGMAVKLLEHKTPQEFNAPYLVADKKLETYWSKKMDGHAGLKVGLYWESNRIARHYEPTSRPSDRSIPLPTLARIATIPGVTWYSLQKTYGLDCYEKDSYQAQIIDFTAEMDTHHGRFMDTAAVMKNLDLVITVDTSMAHLAGALGVPVWVMLRHAADWRWFADRPDSPWYPTMRLFRQKKAGDWNSVIECIMQELPKEILKKQQSQI